MNPTEKFAAEIKSMTNRVDRETKDRKFDWCVVKLSELKPGTVDEQAAEARTMLKPKRGQDAPVDFGVELVAVWMLEGDPTSKPEFPVPMGSFKPDWAYIPKSTLDRKMPLGVRANENDYIRLALEYFDKKGDDETTPVKALEDRMAVWLHDSVPADEPT